VAWGALRGERFVPQGHGLVPGRYLAVLGDLELAMAVRLGGERRVLELAPPEGGIAAGGERTIRVALRAAGRIDQSLLLGLAPRQEERLAPGTWLRTAEPFGAEAMFEGVPAGTYDLFVFDSVLGATFGFGPDPIHRVVRVGETDVEVTVDLDDAIASAEDGR
jgi:hypothetical protein